MDQAQLFKRLHAMSMDEINAFIANDEDASTALFKLDLAARTRKILNSIQLEDIWQEKVNDAGPFFIYLSMKLSPSTLSAHLNFKVEMNNLEWRLVFPKIQDLPEHAKPKNFGEYLALMEQVNIMSIENYDIELACECLDMAYDFSKLRNPPPAFN